MLSEYCREKIGGFLEDYIEINQPGYTYSDEKLIQAAIKCLVDDEIFTMEELQKEILRKASVLLPMKYIASAVIQKGEESNERRI